MMIFCSSIGSRSERLTICEVRLTIFNCQFPICSTTNCCLEHPAIEMTALFFCVFNFETALDGLFGAVDDDGMSAAGDAVKAVVLDPGGFGLSHFSPFTKYD